MGLLKLMIIIAFIASLSNSSAQYDNTNPPCLCAYINKHDCAFTISAVKKVLSNLDDDTEVILLQGTFASEQQFEQYLSLSGIISLLHEYHVITINNETIRGLLSAMQVRTYVDDRFSQQQCAYLKSLASHK